MNVIKARDWKHSTRGGKSKGNNRYKEERNKKKLL